MSEKEYRCEECGKKFDDEEYKVTNDKDKCIYHCEKDDWNNGIENVKKTKFFFKLISSDISKVNDSYLKNDDINKDMKDEYDFEMYKYEYTNVIFPRFGEFFVSFNNTPFDNLNKNIDIFFNRCVFSGDVSFDLIHKAKNVYFQECIFIKEVVFENITFNNNFIFENCTLLSDIKFKSIIFKGIVSFIKTKFLSKLNLLHSRFNESCLLNLTTINDFKLDNSYFREEANFINIQVDNLNRETARVIKHSFEQQNNIIEANKFYALEMKEREKELKWGKDFFEKLIFSIHGWSSNHSQDWLLALFWILNISFLFSYFNQQLDNNLNLLLFFERFFINVVILGLVGYGIYKISKNIRGWFIFIFTILNYLFYGFILTNDYSLYCISNNINPFSLMTGEDDLTFGLLIYKIIIAYLIYQLIVSIRQNTRRK